ncbi:phosphatidylinositol 4,5-bisphosphate 5-phosphatase A-like isoform X2 [Onthophagus taurus]|uniref:phosphatidylinositol 4,5-bisphosphate 5-phosphatase A-like isoform X2 n=1 Tax=Onthophagus taurus TaxID=166361 RepID=UPI000C20C324|nr:phosphatidylinositol 4,5-bisphosphate 5-phosphatase A-like isoform X2 [Onthophagus taurus]
MEDLRVYAVTFNVGTSNPEQDLQDFLSLTKDTKHEKYLPDFYVISLQEVKAQPQNLLLNAFFDDPWTKTCRTLLETRDYIKLKTIRLQGLVMSVYSLRKHLLNIRDIESDYTRTGLSGMWGNKGAVSIRLSIYGCSICFVNAHLSAHDHMLKARIDDYDSILKDQKFHVDAHNEVFFHDYVFWMGDLNFRLMEEYEKTPEELSAMIKRGQLKELLNFDQLKYVMNRGEAFNELEEGEIDFPPTFKFEEDSEVYNFKRRPAWTDRILYKVSPNNYDNIKLKITQLSYKSHPKYVLSDHRPVSSDFIIKVFADYDEEVVQFKDITFWWADDDNMVTYYITKEISETKEDWIGVFKHNFSSLDEYISYEYVYKQSSPIPEPRNPGNASSRGVVKPKEFSIRFNGLGSAPVSGSGLFQLVYFSETEDKVQSVLGVSKPFPLRHKQND